ncbi:uncharacterized protein LOC109810621 [Cajanus cajan]|uniref:Ribonuclease H protein At1g65750 family n=1 Tax=Cajanus cajan TaxID=3821 RepID=A0A151SE66_CAJCA|nr:uncharacterized protein LOC109810621 [Cajanus cajan]KYP53059.1 Putative ribonuclease H protein At1g65750 family [Cajanus cajan]
MVNLLKRRLGAVDWSTTFAVTLDSIWHRRNKFIFQNSSISADQMASEIRARVSSITSGSPCLVTRIDHPADHSDGVWRCPPAGYIKLNGDGAVANNGHGYCEGIVRDSEGKFIIAFARALGQCSVIQFELWAILQGIRMIQAHNLGWQVLVETDSVEAVRLIEEGCDRD